MSSSAADSSYGSSSGVLTRPAREPALGDVSSTTEEFVSAHSATPTATPTSSEPSSSSEIELITVDDDEEETLKQIFYSTEEERRAKAAAAGSTSTDKSCIELKLGKSMALGPGEERSLTLSLKQRLTSRYTLHSHADFEMFQDRIELVMELINNANVQIDLKNNSSAPVSLQADQAVVLLKERGQRQGEAEKRKAKKSPTLMVKKRLVSEGGIKNPASINALLARPARAGSPPPDGSTLKRYNVVLQETIDIPGKSVSYAQVRVENGDDDVFNQVHEIIRHPEFKNAAIFIPERQKKKICKNEKLHMSIRNRVVDTKRLQQGKIVGQILVHVRSGQKRDCDPQNESVQKKRKLSVDSKRPSPPPTSRESLVGGESSQDKEKKVLALLKQAITDGSGSGSSKSSEVDQRKIHR